MKVDIASLRKEYTRASLDETTVESNPFNQFEKWFDEAKNINIGEPNAMVLSTINKANEPSSRVVLLKKLTSKGFIFFTNYESRKGKNIEQNNSVSLLFPWLDLERQLSIEGKVSKISKKESEEYFQTRPKGSQIGAHVSMQSKKIKNRLELENKLDEMNSFFKNKPIPTPSYWGGYIVIPSTFEFWQGRPNRLHDRIRYQWTKNATWEITRLSP